MISLNTRALALLLASVGACVVPQNVVIRDSGSSSDIVMVDGELDDAISDSPSADMPTNMDMPSPDSIDTDAAEVGTDVIADVPSCPVGQTRCMGICTDITGNRNNCGRCGNVCNMDGAMLAPCNDGVCVPICNPGRADCDRDPSNGCEITVATSTANCGGCGTRCPSGPNSMAECAMGMCRLTCAANFANCDNDPANGCEVDLRTTADHCGMCRNRCAFANAATSCSSGVCALGSCNLGFANCDGDGSNGCEANVRTDVNNCGACGTRCMGGFVCSNGVCANSCDVGLFPCNGSCVNRQTDASNCGACGMVCPAAANAAGSCGGGVCSITCAPNYGNCDGSNLNGCEVDTRISAANCGGCARACPGGANAAPTCVASTCGITCNPGFADCNMMAADGCEINIANSNSNCGACGTVCNGGTSCVSGACVCPVGQSLCNGTCVNLSSDNANCGRCGVLCPANTRCSSGSCMATCGAGQMLCSGSCANVASDPLNCGGCGTRCLGGRICSGGMCTCPMGQMDCDGVCTDTGNDRNNCGACRLVCPADRNCLVGRCLCSGGRTDCNGVCVDTNTDSSNCGVCGVRCGAGTSCSGGMCCAAGTNNCGGVCINTDFDDRACGVNCAQCPFNRVCSNGSCQPPPANDRCTNATPINDTIGMVTTLMTNTTGATPHSMGLNCVAGNQPAKTDVYFSFNVPVGARHLVYVDTYGSTFDTVLAFVDSCAATGTGTVINRAPSQGELLCNDDSGMNIGCAVNSNASTLTAVLDGGNQAGGTTYYVLLAGYNNAVGNATIHFVRRNINDILMPVFVPPGSSTHTPTTSGRDINGTACGGMVASGPELEFWWRTCADFAGASVSASTCDANTNFNTLLRYWSSTGGNACNDNVGPPACNYGGGTQSILPGGQMQPMGAGLHMITLDGAQPGPDRGNARLIISR